MVEFYRKPQTLHEALATLGIRERSKAVIAGGTDLLLDIQQGRHSPPEIMLDVSEVEEMRHIRHAGNFILLGAAVTHNEIVRSELLLQHAQCVVEGCGLIGGPQVRNVATIGGNVAHALPAGDGTISLLALNAEANIVSTAGEERWEPLLDIFSGPGKVSFDRDHELLTGFRFPIRGDSEASAFHRIMRPQGVAIAILNMAGWVKMNASNQIEDIHIACGPAGPKPFRAFETENYFKGKSFEEHVFLKGCEILAAEVSLRTSRHRATKDYRQQLLPVLLKEVLTTAIARSR